jgi:hypothetical protein
MKKKLEDPEPKQPRLVSDFVKPKSLQEAPLERKITSIRVVGLALVHTMKSLRGNTIRSSISVVIVALVALAGAGLSLTHHPYDPVPKNIRNAVKFNMYFPNPAQLPAGYNLDINSFSKSSQAVLYTVSYGSNSHLIFTVQRKPSSADIQGFYKNHLPLTIPIQTHVGTAALGVLQNETVISLPTNTNSWIIMTAPLNANQNTLKQVMKAITLAQ